MPRIPKTRGAVRPLHAACMACWMWCAFTSSIFAQDWADGWLPGHDWQEGHALFEATWADSLPQKGAGFKPYHRWMHFAEARFAFEGAEPFRSDAVWTATQWERAGAAARMDPLPSMWHKAVPDGLPLHGGAGRVNRVVIDPSDTARWFACTPSGGLWSSINAGSQWAMLGDQEWAGMGVSDVALHPDEPGCILAATGDCDFGSAYAVGLMRTCDDGATWETTGLSFDLGETQTCSRVHRKEGDPNQILVSTSDGVWLSEDDGASFTQTLSGLCSDLVPLPGDSAVWLAARRPGEIMRSGDGGRTWSAVPDMPSPFLISRIALATSASNPAMVAAIAAKSGTHGLQGIYLSQDSGATFVPVPDVPNILGYTVDGQSLGGQGFYDLAIAIDPTDPNHLVAGGINLWTSWDGGMQWECAAHWYGGEDVPFVHADQHAVSFLPGSSNWVSAHDGGITLMEDGIPKTRSAGLDIAQVYALGWAESRPDRLIAGWQDNGVNYLDAGTHAQVTGTDGFHCFLHPGAPDTLYAAEYFGRVKRSLDGGWSWHTWIHSTGEGVDEMGDWNTPMAFSAVSEDRFFVAKHRVYWTEDHGTTWQETAAIPGAAIEALAIAPTNDSVIVAARGAFCFRSEDRQNWSPLGNLSGAPILDVLFDPQDAQHFWVAFGGYQADDRIWSTADGGASWSSISDGLPAIPVNALACDAVSGDLYAGTDAGVYVRPAGSTEWQPYKSGLPEVLCADLGIRASTGELLLATYGSGLWRAPLHTKADRDAAVMGIHGTGEGSCSGPLDVRTAIRNAGADTLLSVTLLWNGNDTVSYGMVLPPGGSIELSWPSAHRGAVPAGEDLVVRIVDVVGVDGGWSSGPLSSGPDDVAENDVLGVHWMHRGGTGALVMETRADCTPLESAWAILDSAGGTWSRRQHFPLEAMQRDTVCLTHGCHDVLLHDASGNGFAGPQCGEVGSLVLLSLAGDTVWTVTDSAAAGIGFGSGIGGSFCLPIAGWHGCTNPYACNFDPAAASDDGSCDLECGTGPCPADMDGDGLYGAGDILSVLAEFGCLAECSADITGDGAVSANDILALLALYGEACAD